MILKFNATGPKRKELAGLISRFTGNECRYLGAPGFSYEIGRFVVDRSGNVETDSGLIPETERTALIIRFVAGGEIHLWSSLPRPADWKSAVKTSPWLPERASRFVDAVSFL